MYNFIEEINSLYLKKDVDIDSSFISDLEGTFYQTHSRQNIPANQIQLRNNYAECKLYEYLAKTYELLLRMLEGKSLIR